MSQSWDVKYDGVCDRCGLHLHAGEIAVYDRATRTIRCVECPPDPRATDPIAIVDAGVAGRSARLENERRHAARVTRIKGRLGDRLGGLALALSRDPQSTSSWAIGAEGEEKLARALEGLPEVRLLHDRRVPGRRTNIDHIAIAPAGVFVIDAKHLQGRIEIRNRGNIFRTDERLYVDGRDRSSLADGLATQVDVVLGVLMGDGLESLVPVTGVLCFIDGEWPLISRPRSFRGARLESLRSMRKLLTNDGTVDDERVDRITRVLASALPPK